MKLSKKVLIVVLASIVICHAQAQQVNFQSQAGTIQNDEELLLNYLSRGQSSSELKILAENLIKRGQVFFLNYEKQEPIKDESDRQNRQALVNSLNEKGIFATGGDHHSDEEIYPSIFAYFSKFSTDNPDPQNWLEQMRLPIDADYELKSVHIVYKPSTEIKKRTFEISQKVIAQILAEIEKIKSEYKQLSDYDNVKISDGKWEDGDWPSSYPNIFYRYGYGKGIPNSMGFFEKTTENWCNIRIGFMPENGLLKQQSVPGKSYPRQCIEASWEIESENEEINKKVREIVIKCLAPLDQYEEKLENRHVFVVVPTYELNQYIEKYEKGNLTERLKNTIEQFKITTLESKKNNDILWTTQEWHKDPNYYKNLDTKQLAEECFSRSIFMFEINLFDEIEYGYERLRILHNGFAELFNREDLWEGILHAYDYLSAQLDTEADSKQILSASGNLDGICKLYGLSPFREQVKGKEKIFLTANLRTLKRFVWYMENYDSEKRSTPGFFCEPCNVAQAALMLVRQVDPERYNEIITPITSIHWTQEQNIDELKSFLELVLSSLEGFVTQPDE